MEKIIKQMKNIFIGILCFACFFMLSFSIIELNKHTMLHNDIFVCCEQGCSTNAQTTPLCTNEHKPCPVCKDAQLILLNFSLLLSVVLILVFVLNNSIKKIDFKKTKDKFCFFSLQNQKVMLTT